MTSPTCVQCGKELEFYFKLAPSIGAFVCKNNKCPNYALLQVGITPKEQ